MAAIGRVLRPLRTARFRSFSTVQAQALASDSYENDSVVSQKLTKPSVIGIQPWNRLLEPINQSTYITKSTIQKGLPKHFCKVLQDDTTDAYTDLADRFEEIIQQSLLFCYETSPKLKYRHRRIFNSKLRDEMKKIIRKEKISLELMMNTLQLAWISKLKRNLTHKNSVMTYHPPLRASFERGEQHLHVGGQLGHLLLCDSSLVPFSSADNVTSSIDDSLSWSGIISPFFHLHDDQLVKRCNNDGFHSTSKFRHPHTIFVPIKSGKNVNFRSNDLAGQGILYCFGRALTSALSMPGNEYGAERIDPVSVQYLACDDNKLTVVCFQLNTLDLVSDNGVKNFIWIEPDVPLYRSCDEVISGPTRQQRRKYLPHEKATGHLNGFNPDAISIFMNLLDAPINL